METSFSIVQLIRLHIYISSVLSLSLSLSLSLCLGQEGCQGDVPVQHVVVWLPYSVHHDQPWKDDLSIYVDDRYLHLFGSRHYIHQNLDMFHNANLDQSQYQDDIRCTLSQMQGQLDYEDGKAPSSMNVSHDVEYHIGNGFPGKDSRMPVGCQKIHSQEFHLYPWCPLAHQ